MIMLLFLAYLIGSIPCGLILTKLAGYGDIRAIGSGNIGATNVLRTGNKKLAALTLFLDALKGALAACVCLYLDSARFFPLEPWTADSQKLFGGFDNTLACLYGLFAVLGHCFPVWLKFKGGKGVASGIGVLLVAVPTTGLIACALWILVAFSLRLSSLAALVALASAPLTAFVFYGLPTAQICAALAVLIAVRHKDNIRRLLKGEEPKIGSKS